MVDWRPATVSWPRYLKHLRGKFKLFTAWVKYTRRGSFLVVPVSKRIFSTRSAEIQSNGLVIINKHCVTNTVFFIARTLFCLLTPSCLIETDMKDHTGENCSPSSHHFSPIFYHHMTIVGTSIKTFIFSSGN